jgi:hypothetical protein
MSQHGDSGSDRCSSGLFSEDGAETGVGNAAGRVDDFVFKEDMIILALASWTSRRRRMRGRHRAKNVKKAKKGTTTPLVPSRRFYA